MQTKKMPKTYNQNLTENPNKITNNYHTKPPLKRGPYGNLLGKKRKKKQNILIDHGLNGGDGGGYNGQRHSCVMNQVFNTIQ